MRRLEGKRAIVTGAAARTGKMIATRFVEEIAAMTAYLAADESAVGTAMVVKGGMTAR